MEVVRRTRLLLLRLIQPLGSHRVSKLAANCRPAVSDDVRVFQGSC